MGSRSSKILYVAGAGRSGSTLLSRILGQLDGFTAPGELYYFWQEGFVEKRKCECGRRIGQCEFWARVVTETERRVGGIDPSEAVEHHHRVARTRHAPLWTVPGLRRLRAIDESYAELLRAFYESLAVVTGAAVIVDASKLPSYALVLREVLSADLRVVHLVRDPRAVAYSWRRKRHNPATGRQFGRMSLSKSAVLWDLWNVLAERTRWGSMPAPYLRIRYEDFVSHPREVLRQVLAFVEVPRSLESVVEDGQVRLGSGHSVGGNPNRFRTGAVPLRTDKVWVEALGKWPMFTVSALTFPLLLRYGYGLQRPSNGAPSSPAVCEPDTPA
jgi:hypothetical protein